MAPESTRETSSYRGRDPEAPGHVAQEIVRGVQIKKDPSLYPEDWRTPQVYKGTHEYSFDPSPFEGQCCWPLAEEGVSLYRSLCGDHNYFNNLEDF